MSPLVALFSLSFFLCTGCPSTGDGGTERGDERWRRVVDITRWKSQARRKDASRSKKKISFLSGPSGAPPRRESFCYSLSLFIRRETINARQGRKREREGGRGKVLARFRKKHFLLPAWRCATRGGNSFSPFFPADPLFLLTLPIFPGPGDTLLTLFVSWFSDKGKAEIASSLTRDATTTSVTVQPREISPPGGKIVLSFFLSFSPRWEEPPARDREKERGEIGEALTPRHKCCSRFVVEVGRASPEFFQTFLEFERDFQLPCRRDGLDKGFNDRIGGFRAISTTKLSIPSETQSRESVIWLTVSMKRWNRSVIASWWRKEKKKNRPFLSKR